MSEARLFCAVILRTAEAQNRQTDRSEEEGEHAEAGALAEGLGQGDVQLHFYHNEQHPQSQVCQADQQAGGITHGNPQNDLCQQVSPEMLAFPDLIVEVVHVVEGNDALPARHAHLLENAVQSEEVEHNKRQTDG